MTVTKTKSEIISLGRRVLGLDHSRTDCYAVQTDGIDADALIELAARNWYLRLLDEADPALVAPRAVNATAARPAGEAAGTRLVLPSECRRVTAVALPGWHHAVKPLPSSEMSAAVSRQLNPFTRATVDTPVAVLSDAGYICAWPEGTEHGSMAVSGTVDDGAETYTFDEAAVGSLVEAFKTIQIPDYGTF